MAGRGGSYYRARAAQREAVAGHRRHIRGDRSFRKMLARLPEAERESMAAMMEELGGEMLGEMQAAAPVRTGAVRGALSMRLSRKTMRLRVGLIGRPTNRRFYYGRIVDAGRKAQTVTARRRGKAYRLRVRARAPQPFVRGRARDLRRKVAGPRLETFWNRALARAAEGLGDD